MEKVVKKGKIKDLKNNYLFWKSRSYLERLEATEEIRNEYNNWKYGSKQRFQRILRVINKPKN
jgi:hypothetical protein